MYLDIKEYLFHRWENFNDTNYRIIAFSERFREKFGPSG